MKRDRALDTRPGQIQRDIAGAKELAASFGKFREKRKNAKKRGGGGEDKNAERSR